MTSPAFGATQGNGSETHTHRRLRLEMQISDRGEQQVTIEDEAEYTLPHRQLAEGFESLGNQLTQRLSGYEDLLRGDNAIDAVSSAEAQVSSAVKLPPALLSSDVVAGSYGNPIQDGALGKLVLPYQDPNPRGRAESVRIKRDGILYGRGPEQGQTAYPAGPLGDALWQADTAALTVDQLRHENLVKQDAAVLLAQLVKTGGLRSLADFSKLYDGQWKTSMGNVIDTSFYTNQTSDLYFSMQRLTLNPFVLRRLHPSERLPFAVPDDVARNLTTMTTTQLLRSGRLFYADYSVLAKMPLQQGRFAAGCEAYFYISVQDDAWLPLAIKTNRGADLIYTPADAPLDWLFAKMLFGQNDAWDTPWRHLVSTHLVLELPYLAAERCMSENHPVLAMYKKFMLNGFSFRQFLQKKLFAPGTYTDQQYSFSGSTGSNYTAYIYNNAESRFRGNYFPDRLEREGLLNSKFGPPIKHFPYVEDASVIHAAWKTFMRTFVYSTYRKESRVWHDQELACWFEEVRHAGSVDFPPRNHMSRSTLVDILTHVAYLTSVQHQAMNNNDQFISSLLPMSPMSFFKPLPTTKGSLTERDIVSMLPNATTAVGQLALSAAFSRPEFVNSDRALLNIFQDQEFYGSLNAQTKAAAAVFQAKMEKLSAEVAGRRFDAEGLCGGAPFIWRALDPRVALWAMTI
ncbi:hypothetical protein E4U47_006535 [Claviceps purpurea]|nr:hypothetical protein E4U47_006535 [Claviceps purpurea]